MLTFLKVIFITLLAAVFAIFINQLLLLKPR